MPGASSSTPAIGERANYYETCCKRGHHRAVGWCLRGNHQGDLLALCSRAWYGRGPKRDARRDHSREKHTSAQWLSPRKLHPLVAIRVQRLSEEGLGHRLGFWPFLIHRDAEKACSRKLSGGCLLLLFLSSIRSDIV